MNEDLTGKVRNQLSKQEQIILADLWEEPETRKALEKFLGLRQLQIAQMVLKSSADHYFTTEQRGRANELNDLTRMLSNNLKATNKERDS